jgi:hypothetical protein
MPRAPQEPLQERLQRLMELLEQAPLQLQLLLQLLHQQAPSLAQVMVLSWLLLLLVLRSLVPLLHQALQLLLAMPQ